MQSVEAGLGLGSVAERRRLRAGDGILGEVGGGLRGCLFGNVGDVLVAGDCCLCGSKMPVGGEPNSVVPLWEIKLRWLFTAAVTLGCGRAFVR